MEIGVDFLVVVTYFPLLFLMFKMLKSVKVFQ